MPLQATRCIVAKVDVLRTRPTSRPWTNGFGLSANVATVGIFDDTSHCGHINRPLAVQRRAGNQTGVYDSGVVWWDSDCVRLIEQEVDVFWLKVFDPQPRVEDVAVMSVSVKPVSLMDHLHSNTSPAGQWLLATSNILHVWPSLYIHQ